MSGISRFVGKVFLSADPTSDLEAATKHYVDQKSESDVAAIDTTYVKRSGDTMSGVLTLSGAPTANLHAATKKYVDDNKAVASTAAPGKVASSSAQGSSTNYARQDHTHGIDLATGDSNGQVKIAGSNVPVKGLAALAYKESLGKSDVGLGNVDNTSDANKPISTATQTALNAKADKADMEDAEKFRIHVVKGTQTAGTAAWTGEIDVDALYDGLTIAYYLPRAGASGVTLNLTLSGGGTTGAKEVWVSGNTRMSTHYPPGSTVYLTYWSAGSISINGTATTTDRWVGNEYWNSNTVGEYAGACIAGPNGMARYSLILQVDEDHWESLVTTSTTATTKTKNTSGFLLTSPILYQSGSTYAENGVAGYSSVWSTAYSLDSRYSFNCTNAWSSTGKPLYLVGTISGDKFYLKDTTWWADELPSAGDSTYVYWYVGQMHSAYVYTLHPVHPIWEYVGGAWKVRQVDALWYRGTGNNAVQSIASRATGQLAVAEGNNTEASGAQSHAEGGLSQATKQCAHAEGSGTYATGNYSHSEGGGSTASGDGSHAEGNGTTASGVGAHSEGGGSRATAQNAHAEGGSTTAGGQGAHAEGLGTTASATSAHSEGGGTMASNQNAHAEGSNTTASGFNSHSEGSGTIANHASQHVFGEYNVADPSTAGANSRGTYVEIVGNGTSSTRSNVRTLDWSGNEWIAGSQSASDVLLPLTSGSNTRSSLITFINNIASRQNADYKIIEMTANATASSTYAKYPYQYTVTWATATADTWVDGALLSGDYDGDWAVDTANGSVTMYFETNPTATFGLILEDAHIGATTGVTDYQTAINMTQTGTYPDTTLLRQMYQNFQGGCSTIANAITAQGVTTASTASPSTMATNIGTVAYNKWEDGWECYESNMRFYMLGDPGIYMVSHKNQYTLTKSYTGLATPESHFVVVACDGGASGTMKDPPTVTCTSDDASAVCTVTKLADDKLLSNVDTTYVAYGSIAVYRIDIVNSTSDRATITTVFPATNHSAVGIVAFIQGWANKPANH